MNAGSNQRMVLTGPLRARFGLVFAALCISSAAVSWPSSASGEDVESLLQKGNDLRKRGRDREALVEFQRAAQIAPSPRVTGQIALAEQALGLWVEAEADLTKALADPGDPWIAKNRAVLEGALHTIREHVGTIEIWGAPDGAEVLLDDKIVGHLPSVGPISFANEEIALVVRAPGYAPASRALHLRVGSAIREHVDLRRILGAEVKVAAAPAALPPPAPATPPPAPPTIDLASGPARAPAENEHAPVYRKWWFWGGVGAVVAGAAAFLLLSRTGGTTYSCTSDIRSDRCFPAPSP